MSSQFNPGNFAPINGYLSHTGYPAAVINYNNKISGQLSASNDLLMKPTCDFLNPVYQADRSGFDIAGCRYDMKLSPQNFTQYGPPLSFCGTYDNGVTNACGTVFYPLNA